MKYALTILAALIATPAVAQSQARCAPEAPVLKMLLEKHGEVPFAEALSKNGSRVVITVNPESREYSVLMINPQKIACLVDAGESFGRATDTPKPVKKDLQS